MVKFILHRCAKKKRKKMRSEIENGLLFKRRHKSKGAIFFFQVQNHRE